MNKYFIMAIIAMGILSCDNIKDYGSIVNEKSIDDNINEKSIDNDIKELAKDSTNSSEEKSSKMSFTEVTIDGKTFTRPDSEYPLKVSKVTIDGDIITPSNYDKEFPIASDTTPDDLDKCYGVYKVHNVPRIVQHNINELPLIDWNHGAEVGTNGHVLKENNSNHDSLSYNITDTNHHVIRIGAIHSNCEFIYYSLELEDYKRTYKLYYSSDKVTLTYWDNGNIEITYYLNEDSSINLNQIYAKNITTGEEYPDGWDSPKTIDEHGVHF